MILYFSGTGNSEYVANRIGEILGEEVFPMLKYNDYACDSKRIIWVFPTYSWGVPPVVKNVISNINLPSDCEHYMVTTCGDDIGNCHKMWKALICKRVWKTHSTYSIIMPNTYVFMKGFDVDSYDLVKTKLSAADDRILEIANKIKVPSEPQDDVKKGGFAWIKTNIIYPYFVRFCMNPKKFVVSDSCTGCGLCKKKCPLDNISLKDDRPKWGDTCAFCLRCYHQCPHHAIDYDKTARFKGQYLFSRYSNLVKK